MIRPHRSMKPSAAQSGYMMRRRGFLGAAFAAGAGLLLASSPVMVAPAQAADEQAAGRYIDEMGRLLLSIQSQPGTISQREAQYRQFLGQGLDLNFIARFVLGRSYRDLNPDQASEYHDAFNEFVLRTYARRLAGFQVRGFAITGLRAAGDADTVVSTRIDVASGQPVQCDWRVRETNQRFAVIDLALEGVSMSLTQRNEFASLINSNGVAGLIAVLRARVDRETISAAR
ncbi:phospholipid-binding protein MlaC [Ferrovibrio sp.]|uniref:MlaC/ttg2D family ABC transporter substrate-binding protein n=1 Tax=Ferrovibrio sp. TaxID=1917215 RepID=UPI0035B01DFB